MKRHNDTKQGNRLIKVKHVLSENPRGLTIGEISDKIKINRNSVAKYLEVLRVSGQVEMRALGPAKLFYLSHRIPISSMMNLSSDYIVTLDSDLKILHVNDNLVRLLDREKDALTGLGIDEFPHPIFKSREILAEIDKADSGKSSTIEVRSKFSGKDFYFHTRIVPATFEDGSHGVILCMEDITKRKQAENALRERIKELNCLYGISQLVEKFENNLESILEGVVHLIPPAWQFPEITCCRIIFNENVYESANFKEAVWRQSGEIRINEEKVGVVEVYYLERKPDVYEGPFTKEERNLLNAIAERLGKIIKRIKAEEMLRATTG